ncbi:MAG TPA: heme-binding domain-containing protein [Bacteroidia bacterium]|nr:heme-binding domain-containing protein [Bacteroidia bacterium]
MSKKKKIFIILISLLVFIQFIRPERNVGVADTTNDIKHSVTVDAEVKNILEKSCYDCHSNHTNYPWYANIQPVAGWLAHHVTEGKDELNFSEFNTYKLRRKTHKLKEVVEQIKKGEMPMSSYLIIHKDAELNEEQKSKLIKWAEESILVLQDTLKDKK